MNKESEWRCLLGNEAGTEVTIYDAPLDTVTPISYGNSRILWLESKLLLQPRRVMWLEKGAYPEQFRIRDHNKIGRPEFPKHDLIWEVKPAKLGSSYGSHAPFLVNHSTCEQIYLDACREIELKLFGDTAHPLPYLTSIWTSLDKSGMTDPLSINLIGAWAWDLLQTTTFPVPGYATVYPIFGDKVETDPNLILKRGRYPDFHMGLI